MAVLLFISTLAPIISLSRVTWSYRLDTCPRLAISNDDSP